MIYNGYFFYYRLEKIAEANRNRVILEAEAEAEAIKIKGDAEAFSMMVKGKAEAEQLTMKADAYKFYKDAAMVEMLLDVLPKVKLIACACIRSLILPRVSILIFK